jgi:tetraacyldisaccharide 4'-kinase
LLDDGFQHRRLGRDLDVVLVDATEPFGLEYIFPRGTLREPLTNIARAQVIALSRADLVSAAERQQIKARYSKLAPESDWIELSHRPARLLWISGRSEPIASLVGSKVNAFCGIGNPEAFRRTLETAGCEVNSFRIFPDHHNFTPSDLRELASWAAHGSPELVVCTHKDLVKFKTDDLGGVPLAAIGIELAITAGRELLEARLTRIFERVVAKKL